MKTQPKKFFWTKLFFSLSLFLLHFISTAQVQWYQNQDGNNLPPNGTVATSIQSLTPSSFVACYLWNVNDDQYTWKISKSHINGTEQKTVFKTGTTSMIEVKRGNKNSIYVLERNFPLGQNAEYTVYKLDTNLVVKAQKSISFPNSFNIFNLNAFELDNLDNIYLAGDGQYPDGYGFSPASFVLKADKNLVTKWSRMDSTQTSFTQLHIDHYGSVLVVADFYTFFPDVRVTRISPTGQYINTRTIKTDPGRFSLFSKLDNDDDLLLYGGKSVNDTEQAMYLYKVSRYTGNVIYKRTYFKSPGSQLNDFKLDGYGNIFSLVTQYLGPDNQVCRVSRISSHNGNVYWNRSFYFSQDSCLLLKLVVNESDQIYAVGERRSRTYFSKGFAMRIKKNGQTEGNFPAPDSVLYQRSHTLVDGITDRNNQLIAIGNTNDMDTTTYASSYFRSFAVQLGANRPGCNNAESSEAVTTAVTAIDTDAPELSNRLVVFPNPVQNQLTVSNLLQEQYDRITVHDMQGTIILQQSVSGNSARMDVTTLVNGVYLLVLHSSSLKNEKSIKFVVSR
jgi:hypothetical protein